MAIKPHHFITRQFIIQLLTVGLILAVAVVGVYFYSQSLLLTQKVHTLTTRASGLDDRMAQIKNKLASTSGELEHLKLDDQYVRNNRLEDDLNNVKRTYSAAVKVYENLVKLREKTAKIPELEPTLMIKITPPGLRFLPNYKKILLQKKQKLLQLSQSLRMCR